MKMDRVDLRKEELLSLLTEIYDQLEELDQTLEKHFANYRKDFRMKQSTRLSNLQHELSTLEKEYIANSYRGRKTEGKDSKFQRLFKFKPSY